MQHGDLIPREVISTVPRITLTGMERLRVEQHKGLIVYRPEEIGFRTSCGLLRIEGEDLRFSMYAAAEAIITGQIRSVFFSDEGAGK